MVTKMLTLNTAHLTQETLEVLTYEAAWEDAGAHKEKKFPLIKVYCVGHPNITGVTYIIDTDRIKLKKTLEENNNLPEDLRMVLIEAFGNWCDTIRLRDDGPVCNTMPKYNCE
jgi:hypothetical protein